ncbi:MAG: tyrosine-type recombinase/integrase [Haloechinothrix sp.]
MTHLSKWMAAHQLAVAELTAERVEQYLDQRRSHGYATFRTRPSLAPLLEVLAAVGAPLNEPGPPVSAVEELLDGYAHFLLGERGLAASTTKAYVLRARRFLDWHGHGADLRAVDTAVVTSAVLAETEAVSAGSAQFFVVALRSFLRFCHLTDLIETDLSAASLPVTGRRRSVLPRGISAADARSLLKACDRRTVVGRRDYVVILLLMRLGLRSCEVAALRLEDIDWRAGVITIHGKAGRLDQLPLPAEVGEAIAAYLRHARPADLELREVFVRSIAPRSGLSREAIGCLVRRASIRAGLKPLGPHRLRHGLACDMVAAGVPLGQIGQVLRHADGTSTSIYARVDVERLRTLARPWPTGGAR